MIWSELQDEAPPLLLKGVLYRIVESQEQVATNQLCDSFQETDILENMLDRLSKPKNIHGSEGLHYLLASPWRYPPLNYGSRFGSKTERSLLYGSKSEETCLAESAFYRLKFFFDMKDGLVNLRSRHTVFDVSYQTKVGLKLQEEPFSTFADILTNKSTYGPCQQLGSDMRAAGIEAIEFTSARDPKEGINVALFSPSVLASDKPENMSTWFCLTTPEEVSFARQGRPGKVITFRTLDFYHNGIFPAPAK